MDDQILIIFGTNISDTTDHQMTIYVPSHQVFVSALLHYLGKTKQAKY